MNEKSQDNQLTNTNSRWTSPIADNKQCISALLAVVHWEYTDHPVLVEGSCLELPAAAAD